MKKNIIMILFLFLWGTGCSMVKDAGMGSSSHGAGGELTQAQHFTLKNLKGEAVDLDQVLAQNKAVLIDFWATWCGYCVEEMPELVKLQEKQEPRGFTILAVDVGENAEQAARFAKRMGLNFPVLLDDDSTVAGSFGLVGIPTSFLIGPDGRILGEYHSYTKQLEADIEKALAA